MLIDQDLALLEQKLASLIAHTRALRAANESLRHELATSRERNVDLKARIEHAGARLDALLARMPAE
jgi:regulator of replication initiation timing